MSKSSSKKISQYSSDGVFIKTWESIKSATDYYRTGIDDCLARKTNTSSGYIWRYEDEKRNN